MTDTASVTPLTRPLPGDPPVPTVPEPERFTLANGLRVLAVQRRGLPQIAARVVVPAGSAADPVDAPGTAAFVGSLLVEGTESLPPMALNEQLDQLGASLSARVGHDFAEVDLNLLSETLEEGITLLADVLSSAAFPAREVERVRAETLDALEARLDEPANVADDRMSESVFGFTHPYGRLPIGTPEGVSALRQEALLEFHRARFRPEGCVLVISGDLDVAVLAELLDRVLAGWRGSVTSPAYPDLPSGPAPGAEILNVEWPDAAQGEIRVAGLGIPRNSPDWIPAGVANYILGGSTITGRLGANLRENKGWTYGVRSGFAAGIHPGGWVLETAVEAEVTHDAFVEIDRELKLMIDEPVSEEELTRAKEALILSLPRAFETPARIVSRFAALEAYGLEADYWKLYPARVQRVTREDVSRIAASHFAPDRLVRVAVGPRLNGAR